VRQKLYNKRLVRKETLRLDLENPIIAVQLAAMTRRQRGVDLPAGVGPPVLRVFSA